MEHRPDGHERAADGQAVLTAAAQRLQGDPVQLAAGWRRHAGSNVVVEVVEQQPKPFRSLGGRERLTGRASVATIV